MDKKLKLFYVMVAFGLFISSCVKNHKEITPQASPNEHVANISSKVLSIESLLYDFKLNHPESKLDSAKLVNTYKWFLDVNDSNGNFSGLKPC